MPPKRITKRYAFEKDVQIKVSKKDDNDSSDDVDILDDEVQETKKKKITRGFQSKHIAETIKSVVENSVQIEEQDEVILPTSSTSTTSTVKSTSTVLSFVNPPVVILEESRDVLDVVLEENFNSNNNNNNNVDDQVLDLMLNNDDLVVGNDCPEIERDFFLKNLFDRDYLFENNFDFEVKYIKLSFDELVQPKIYKNKCCII
jgi:hypothetical protein